MSNYTTYFAIEKELKTLGFDGSRDELIQQFTNNRKSGLRELNEREYPSFINWLNQFKKGLKSKYDPENQQRRKIISMFHKMGYQINGEIDLERLNNWCCSYGHLHQPLMSYKGNDLVKLVTQAEKYYESYINAL